MIDASLTMAVSRRTTVVCAPFVADAATTGRNQAKAASEINDSALVQTITGAMVRVLTP